MWLCSYNHRHGTDTMAFRSNDEAIHGACRLIVDNIDEEVEELQDRKDILKLIIDRKYSEAIVVYERKNVRHEDFEIHETEMTVEDESVLGEDAREKIKSIDEELAQEKKDGGEEEHEAS